MSEIPTARTTLQRNIELQKGQPDVIISPLVDSHKGNVLKLSNVNQAKAFNIKILNQSISGPNADRIMEQIKGKFKVDDRSLVIFQGGDVSLTIELNNRSMPY